jgi:pSer/pThr/pTyr-binding forkhead associated (FHA) protein
MKSCPSCKAKNEERSLFCRDCGTRLPAGSAAAAEAASSEGETVFDPSVSVVGVAIPVAPGAVETPAAPSQAPATGGTCIACGYRLPQGRTVSWCPGCGRNFDPAGGTGTGAARVDTPVASVAASAVETPPPMERTQTKSFTYDTAQPFSSEPAPIVVPPGWSLVLLKAGERLDRYPLRKAVTVLGRAEGEYTFPDDPLVSPRHARITCRGRSFWLEDLGSRNGIYLRARFATELNDGDLVTFGSLLFRYEPMGAGPFSTSPVTTTPDGVKVFGSGREKSRGRLVRILADGSDGPAYPLTTSRTIVGRKVGHFLFPDDPLLSRQHVQFYERDGEMWVEDLGSSNGTLIRVKVPVVLEKGVSFRMGDVTLEVTAP